MTSRSYLSRCAPAALALLLSTCGGGGPSSNTPATTTPAATPPTTTTTMPAQVATSCSRLGFGNPNATCSRQTGNFDAQYERALDTLIARRPEIFNLNDAVSNGGYKVRSLGQLIVGVIAVLEEQGVCGDWDGEELQITNTLGYNDQYDMLTADGYLRRGLSAYRSTCTPAAFPTPAPALGSTPGCSLPGSREKACGAEQPLFLQQVDDSIEEVARAHPEVIDVNNRKNENWYKVLDGSRYTQLVVESLTRKNLCARYDGEELAVKGENTRSDQYDIYVSDGYTRRGLGSYRTTCYPAAF